MRLLTRQFAGSTLKASPSFAVSGGRHRFSSSPGFTLVELVMTIVIVGIMAAVAVPRFFDNNVFQARGATDQLKAALRFAQKVAIAQHTNVSVTLSAAASSDCGVQLVAGSVSCVISNSVAVAPALPQTLTFDALGRPLPNVVSSFTVGTAVITVERETGYVH